MKVSEKYTPICYELRYIYFLTEYTFKESNIRVRVRLMNENGSERRLELGLQI